MTQDIEEDQGANLWIDGKLDLRVTKDNQTMNSSMKVYSSLVLDVQIRLDAFPSRDKI